MKEEDPRRRELVYRSGEHLTSSGNSKEVSVVGADQAKESIAE